MGVLWLKPLVLLENSGTEFAGSITECSSHRPTEFSGFPPNKLVPIKEGMAQGAITLNADR
jgi:hypothetical protein